MEPYNGLGKDRSVGEQLVKIVLNSFRVDFAVGVQQVRLVLMLPLVVRKLFAHVNWHAVC